MGDNCLKVVAAAATTNNVTGERACHIFFQGRREPQNLIFHQIDVSGILTNVFFSIY